MKRYFVIVAIKVEHNDLEISRYLKWPDLSFAKFVKSQRLKMEMYHQYQNIKSIPKSLTSSEHIFDVPRVMHRNFPATVMVLGVVSNEGHVMPPHFFPQGLRVNSAIYIEVLETVVKPWIKNLRNGRPYMFQ